MITRHMGLDHLHLRDDGRTVEGRIVPYGEVAEIVETDSVTGQLVRYHEQFLPRSLARMAQGITARGNGSMIPFVLDHEEDFDSKIGHTMALEDREDGAYATLRLYESKDLLKVQSMLRESHTGLSIGFVEFRPHKMLNNVVSRVQVTLKHIAATPVPAYAGAGIVDMRESVEPLGSTPELDRVKEMLSSLRRQ